MHEKQVSASCHLCYMIGLNYLYHILKFNYQEHTDLGYCAKKVRTNCISLMSMESRRYYVLHFILL